MSTRTSSDSNLDSSPASNGFMHQQALDVLDPEEFEIPEVEEQTLDEILQEQEDPAALLLEAIDVSPSTNEFAAPSEAGSEASSVRSNATNQSRDWKHPRKERRKSDMLRCDKMRGVTAQLQSASERVNAGVASALAVFSAEDQKRCVSLIAVGTSHGTLLVFDTPSQSLKFSLGASAQGNTSNLGAISCLSFCPSGSRLLIGYSKGHVQLVDVDRGRSVLTLRPDQTHQAGKGVLHICFTQQNTRAVCVDTGGSVFELVFNSGITGLTTKMSCVFSGCHGEVTAVSPLIVPNKLRATAKHYAQPLLLAMASLTKAMVVCLKPPTRVLFSCNLTGAPESPPLIAWQWVPIQISSQVRITDPVLTFSRGTSVNFYQLHTSDGDEWRSFFLKKVDLPFVCINMQWLSQRCLLFMDTSEKVHLYEVSSGNTWNAVESLDVTDCQMVYASSDFKGLATGGSVSAALRCMSDQACYHSISVDNHAQCYILGANALYTVSMRSWLERVESLESNLDLIGAIQLALDFYSGRLKTGGAARVGVRWREIIADKVTHMVGELAERSMHADRPNSTLTHVLLDHYKRVIPICIDSCTHLSRLDLLYTTVYDIFSTQRLAKGLFLECLEDRLLDGHLKNIPPALIQEYLNHLAQESMLGAVEASIVRLPIDCLDLHQVMTLCRNHNLYDGIIYVNNRALKDYITPLKEMLDNLQSAMSAGDGLVLLSDVQIQLGNKILLYLSCCLCGRAYPIGALSSQEAETVSGEIYKFISAVRNKMNEDGDSSYPYLRLLLKFDTREFLNVLSMAFDSELFASETGFRSIQKLLDIMIDIVLSGCEFSAVQLGALLTFVARLAVQQKRWLQFDRTRLHELLKSALCAAEEAIGTSSFEERQQAVLELLQAPIGNKLLDKKLILYWAETGKYLQICEHLYWEQRNFDKLLDVYLQDLHRKTHVLRLLHQMLGSTEISSEEKLTIKRYFLENVESISQIDPHRCAQLMLDYLSDSLNVVYGPFQDDIVQMDLLAALFSIRRSTGHRSVSKNVQTDRAMVEKYIELLCRQNSENQNEILDFVKNWWPFCEDNDSVLRTCRKEKIYSVAVYLLEKRGEFTEAYDILNDAMDNAQDELDFISVSRETFGFCHRFSTQSNLDEKARQMWFELLDRLLDLPQNTIKNSTEAKELIGEVVHAMINCVPPADVLERLFEHPTFKSCTYAEHQDLISNIIHGYDYQHVLLEKVLNAVESDVHGFLSRGCRRLNHGFSAANQLMQCSACSQLLEDSGAGTSFMFPCGHVLHVSCVPDSKPKLCPLCSKQIEAPPLPKELTKPRAKSISASRQKPLRMSELLDSLSEENTNPFAEETNIYKSDKYSLRLIPPKR